MSIYHCSIKVISRGKGQSCVASSAYRSGEKMIDERTDTTHDYTRKGGVVFSEVQLPKNAPDEFSDRSKLWNSVEQIEKQANAQLSREIEVALPIELDRDQQIDLIRNYVQKNFVDEGMCADWSIHDKGDGNPHCHIMLTMRPLKESGEWGTKEKKVYALDDDGNRIPMIDPATGEQKVTKTGRKVWKRETVQANTWNDQGNAEKWRKAWADECNKLLEPMQHIDHRSFERRGIDLEPTIHEGYTARKIEEKGGVSERCTANREIRERNGLIQQISDQIQRIMEMLNRFKEKSKQKGEEAYERFGDLLARARGTLERNSQTEFSSADGNHRSANRAEPQFESASIREQGIDQFLGSGQRKTSEKVRDGDRRSQPKDFSERLREAQRRSEATRSPKPRTRSQDMDLER